MTKVIKTKAAKLASTGSTLAFVGIVLGGPILGVPAIILGVQALKAMTPQEKAEGMQGPKNQAVTAIVAGALVSLGWIVWLVVKLNSR